MTAPTIHKRLLALFKDDEVPKWCHASIALGFAVPGPLDEVVIYPAVLGFLWLRRRHVLARHGFTGTHVLAALVAVLFVTLALGLAVRVLSHMFGGVL